MNESKEHLLWPHWPEFVKAEQDCRFIAQGTLINRHSIGKTIDSAHLHGPVLASGVRRIFNFALEHQNYEEHGGRYQRSPEQSHCATLNVLQTGDPRDKVNGILFSTTPGDIDALAEREFGYDLLPVDYRQGDESGSGFLFIARKESEAIGHRVRDDILPNESSLSTCLAGAATYGRAFVDTWIESCYLANGTPLMGSSYYRQLVLDLLKRIDF